MWSIRLTTFCSLSADFRQLPSILADGNPVFADFKDRNGISDSSDWVEELFTRHSCLVKNRLQRNTYSLHHGCEDGPSTTDMCYKREIITKRFSTLQYCHIKEHVPHMEIIENKRKFDREEGRAREDIHHHRGYQPPVQDHQQLSNKRYNPL